MPHDRNRATLDHVTTPTSTRRTWLPWAIAGGVLVAVLAVIGGALVVLTTLFRPDPDFVSLALVPDPTLSGTVAYFDDESLCVRVVAAAGQPNREVYCLDSQQPSEAEKEGKDVGVDIEWLSDDRLQLTGYRMRVSEPPPMFEAAWRRIIDIDTGEIENVPLANFAGDVPQRPCVTTRPSGQTLTTRSEDGRAVVTLSNGGEDRVLLDVRGNPETYGIAQACWSPDFTWVYTHDTRMLIITTGESPVTRTLTPPLETYYGYDDLSWYAINPRNLLTE